MSTAAGPPREPASDVGGRRAWARHVAAHLAALPARQADALRMLYFDRLTDGEIADRMSVSVDRARTAMADGSRNLGVALLGPT